MKLDTLVKFHNDLIQLDPNELTVVQYSPTMGLIYRQLGKVVSAPYIGYLYFPTKLKLGILTPDGYRELISNLEKLIQEPAVNEGLVSTIIREFETEVYKIYAGAESDGPQLLCKLEYVNITNSILSKWSLKRFNPNSRVLLKSLLRELKSAKN